MTYQNRAYETAAYGNRVEYPFCSLAEEAGEVMGKLNKYVRKHNVTLHDALDAAIEPHSDVAWQLRDDLIKELGDLRWNLAACCTELGITEQELENTNLIKLAGRKSRGTIDGFGDNR